MSQLISFLWLLNEPPMSALPVVNLNMCFIMWKWFCPKNTPTLLHYCITIAFACFNIVVDLWCHHHIWHLCLAVGRNSLKATIWFLNSLLPRIEEWMLKSNLHGCQPGMPLCFKWSSTNGSDALDSGSSIPINQDVSYRHMVLVSFFQIVISHCWKSIATWISSSSCVL